MKTLLSTTARLRSLSTRRHARAQCTTPSGVRVRAPPVAPPSLVERPPRRTPPPPPPPPAPLTRRRPRRRRPSKPPPPASPPPAAPASEGGSTGLVERLPSSAYPEPVDPRPLRQLALADIQGLQWPYYPRIGVGISGYGWVDTDYKRSASATRAVDHTRKLFCSRGASLLRVTPTYSNGNWFVQAQAELIANLDQLDAAAAERRGHRRSLGPHRRLEKLGPDRRPVRGVRDLPPAAWASTSTPTSASALTTTNSSGRPAASTARATCTTGRRGRRTSRSTSIPAPVPARRAARAVGQRRPVQRASAAARRSSTTSAG